MDPLLQDIAQNGWTESNAQQFLAQYDLHIKRYIVKCMLDVGFPYEDIKQAEGKEISEAAYDRVLDQLLKEGGKLIRGYLEKKKKERGLEFKQYLNGVIWYCTAKEVEERTSWGGINGLSEMEILNKIIDTKRPRTREFYIRAAKAHFRDRVWQYLYAKFHKPAPTNVMAYFFEVFVPKEYPAIRDMIRHASPSQEERPKRGKGALDLLLEKFSAKDWEIGLGYKKEKYPPIADPTVVGEPKEPVAPGEEPKEWEPPGPGIEKDVSKSLRANMLKRYDRVIKCTQLDPQQLQGELGSFMTAVENRAIWEFYISLLASAKLKKTASPAIRGWLPVYLDFAFKHQGPEKATWDEICRLHGKNPDYPVKIRVREKLKQEFKRMWESIKGEPYEFQANRWGLTC